MDTTSERVCYVNCNFCNTILVVSIPCASLYNTLTIRCGHCANFLYVNMGGLQQTVHLQEAQKQNSPFQDHSCKDYGSSSSRCNKGSVLASSGNNQAPTRVLLPTASPQKKQRVPSAYNRFIKEEIQRIKTNNPEISHREAFSTAAKNWAHFPHLQFNNGTN